MKTALTAALCGALAFSAPAQRDIVDTAVAAGSFKTLAAALTEAGLVDTLKGKGPFTVFAPTDDAFGRLPDGALRNLLRSENRDRLTAILTFHVVAGRVPAEQVVGLRQATTVNGQRVDISVDGDGVRIDGANVVKTDIECSNGIIHVIDRVLMPIDENLVQVAAGAKSFGTLLKAATAAGLADTLSNDGPFTVLAPTDEAFAKLPEKTLVSLLEPKNRDQLTSILKYHVFPGRIYSDQAVAVRQASSLQKSDVRFAIRGGQLVANDAKVIGNDIEAGNGVVHVIDTVLMPPKPRVPDGRLVIGFFHETPSAALASQLGIDRTKSFLVTRLTKGGSAERGGLKPFDVIVSIDGKPATGSALTAAKKRAGYDGSVEVTVIRGGKQRKLDLTVGIERH